MIKLPAYFISDLHFQMNFSNFENSRRNKLFKLFDKIKQEQATLIIGGDFFDFWFEYKNVIPKGYDSLIYQLKILSETVDIHYVVGNHDFWDFGFFKNILNIHTHYNDFDFKINNKNIKVTHGDGILKNDLGYRIMKKIIRHKIFINLFNLINPNIGCTIAKKISKTSAHFNHKTDLDLKLKQEIVNYWSENWIQNYDTVLIGHYHLDGIEKKNNKNLIFMGDWINKFTVTKLDQNLRCTQFICN